MGCLFYSPRFSFTEDFLTSMPSSEGYTLLEQHFPKGALAPTTVLIKAPQAPPEFVAGMITGALNQSPGVAAAFPTGTARTASCSASRSSSKATRTRARRSASA